MLHPSVTSIQTALLNWFAVNRRHMPWRDTVTPYGVWVSEVMLQQTQVKTVIPYYLNFMERYPDVTTLAAADLEPILKAWEGLGYYARARNLHKAAGIVATQMNGIIPGNFEQFISLPGVGDYIASAVLSIAFGKSHAVVDGNVKRVLARIFCMDTPVNRSNAHKSFKQTATQLLYTQDPGTFNQAVMELGALVCTPASPSCDTCPVMPYCTAFREQKTAEYPKRIQKARVPTHHISVGIVKKDGQLLITRRKLSGLLGGLWEFPGGKVEPGETAEQACVREIMEETGLEVRISSFLTRIKHAYTHFRIEMDVFYCDYTSGQIQLNGPIDHQWVKPEDLERYPFPRANLKFMSLVTKNCP